ncbi:MAG: hypothetical protein JSS49_19835 [Planctomycetes bacterium]|nr:hypothetical protein [Planctomycetota bacterium]
MRSLLPKSRRQLVAFGLFMPTLIAMFLTSGLFQWTPLNCWHDDVDINTGCVRHTRYLLFCKIADHTDETWLSSAIKESKTAPDWRRVNTFSPGVRHSPRYRFHGAIQQIRTLELAGETIRFEPNARRKVADILLRLWQNGESYLDADEFVENVAQTAIALQDGGAPAFREADVPAGKQN